MADAKPKFKELPGELDEGGDSNLSALDFDAAEGLVGFGLGAKHSSHDEILGISGYTPSELYDLNQQLLNDVAPTRPLIDEVVPMASLRSEYENGSVSFLKQIDWLIGQGYTSIRRTRGDGDCFYRSLAFAYIERLSGSSDDDIALNVATSLSILSSSRDLLESAGVEKIAYEDFYDEFVGLIQNIVEPNEKAEKLTPSRLLSAFQDDSVSNSVVVYLRFLTSTQIRLNREDYEAFIVHPDTKEFMDLVVFCSNFVEPMGKEADNVEMLALCRALNINLDVAYLDGRRPDGTVDLIDFRGAPDDKSPPLLLLYRPGHYDILVKDKV